MVASALDDAGDDFGEFEVGGLEDEVGAFAVVCVALLEHEADGFLGVFGVEKGAFFVAGGALENGLGLGDEPDDEAEVAEELAVFGPENDSATSGNDAFVAFVLLEVA